jgi:hypothetical protein
MADPTIRIGNIAEFKPQKRNLNRHTQHGTGMLNAAMRTDGFVSPITTANDGEAIDGSLRLEESADVFGDEVLVIEHDGTRPIVMKRTDIQNAEEPIAKHIAVAANRIAEVDWSPDPLVLAELQAEDATLLDDLYRSDEIDKLLEDLVTSGKASPTTIEQVDGELPGVKSLKDYTIFASDLAYDIPALLPEMLFKDPFDIQVWAGPRQKYDMQTEQWLYVWGSDSIKGLDLSKTLICFYTDDYRFENFWYEPAEYTGKLLNAGVAGVIMPNFSMYWDMPQAARIWQKYRSNWCARYFQEAGIAVLPEVQMSPRDGELCWAGIPPGVPIAMQFHTKLKDDLWDQKIAFCKQILEVLHPSSVLAYADERGWKKIQDAGISASMFLVKSRVSIRREYMESTRKEVI